MTTGWKCPPASEGSLSDSQIWGRLLAINLDYDRQTALDLASPFESVHRYEITLCHVYRFETLPKNQAIQSKWGSFKIDVQADVKDSRKLLVEFRTRLEKTRIESADFEAFRQYHESVFKNYRVWLTLTPTTDLADAGLLQEALRKTPSDPAIAAALARILALHDKKADARRILEKARQQNPSHTELWELTVKTAESLKDQEAAYAEMVKRFPDALKYQVALGETRVNLGDQAGARAALEPLKSAGADVWRGLAEFQLARSCMLENHLPEALEHLESAARLNSEGVHSVVALQLKGQLHEKLGQNSEAIDAFRQALLQESDSESTLASLIRLELKAGHRSDALDLLRRLTVAAGNQSASLIQAAKFHLQMDRFDDAFDLVSRAAPDSSEVSKTSEVCRIKGLVYLQRQDYPRAVAHLEKAQADPAVLEGLIRGYLAMGKLVEAERQAERVDQITEATMPLFRAYASIILLEQRRLAVLQECPAPANQSEAWNRAVDAFVCAERANEGRPTSASAAQVEKLLQVAISDGMEIGPALALRGLLALEKGRLSKAAQDAERAIHLTPKESRGFYVRGRIRFERNEPEALADLLQAAKLSRRLDPAILHWLAAAQYRAGKTDEAIASEQEGIKLNGHEPEFQEQLREFQKSMKAVKKQG